MLVLGDGAALATELVPSSVRVTGWQLEASTGSLAVTARGAPARPVTTSFGLWPLPEPSRLQATVDFAPRQISQVGLLTSPTREILRPCVPRSPTSTAR